MSTWVFVGRKLSDSDPDVVEAMFDPGAGFIVRYCDLTDAPIFAEFLSGLVSTTEDNV